MHGMVAVVHVLHGHNWVGMSKHVIWASIEAPWVHSRVHHVLWMHVVRIVQVLVGYLLHPDFLTLLSVWARLTLWATVMSVG